MRRPAYYVPSGELRTFLEGFSKSALMELVYDFGVSAVGEEEAMADPRLIVQEIIRREGAIRNALGRNQ